MASATGSMGSIEVYNNGSGNDAFMAFHTGSDFAFYFGLDADANDLAVGGWSMGANKYKVLHLGNIDDALTSTAVEVGTGFEVGKGTSTASYMHIGQGATGDNYAYIDLVGDTTYTDYGLRLIRGDGGTNTYSQILHKGTGNLEIKAIEAGAIVLKTSNTTALTIDSSQNATFAGTITGAGNIYTSNGKIHAQDSGTGQVLLQLEADLGTNNNRTLNLYSPEADTGDSPFIFQTGNALSFKIDNNISIAINSGGTPSLNYAGSQRLTTTTAGVTVTGTVSDSKGNLRSIPRELKSSAYTLVAADAGKCVVTDSGVTVPHNVLGTGDAVTIINNSSSDITITQASSLVMNNSADASSGNRTLAGKGMATVWFSSGAEAYISGAGLS